jgi:hypothetical protein
MTSIYGLCDGLGDGDGDGLGDGDGVDAMIDGVGRIDGSTDGLSEGDGEADGDGEGDSVHAPCRNGSWLSLPHPCTTPAGRAYQPFMLAGSAFTNRLMIVRPTFSPIAVIKPPPPLGAVFPTQTPVTI